MNALLLTALFAGAPPTPPSQFAPALYVKVVTPEGVRLTLRPGTPEARSYDTPVTFGVRPGYIIRFRLEGLPDAPGLVIDPSLEVRASLFIPVNLKPEDYPATLTLTDDDVRKILGGGVVTKVIYLENPDLAPAASTTPDQPLERDVLRGEDPLEEARKLGRPLAIARFGGLSLSQQELIAADVSGAVQGPGEPLLPPSRPPMIPAMNFQGFDPIAGPKIPMEELLQDGGDVGLRIGIGPGGRLGNVDVTDTAIEYTAGRTHRAAVSNRICLFAPRFPILRQELSPAGYDVALPPLLQASAAAPALERIRREAKPIEKVDVVMLTRNFYVLRGTQTRVGLEGMDNVVGPIIHAQVEGIAVRGTVIEPDGLTQYRDQCKPDQPLVLIKSADPREARPGDIVTFTIKYVNYGSRAARDIVVADSLASRLEYVPGSSRGDRPSVFTMQANTAGSMVLRWQVAGEIPPGQSGLIQFQAKVR